MSTAHLSANQWINQGETSSSCHAHTVNTEQQYSSVHSLSKQRNLTQKGRQAESCNFLCYQTDADWQSSYWIFCPWWGVLRGAAGAGRHNSRSYVKYVNNCRAELAASCWSLLLQPTTEAINSLSDSERKINMRASSPQQRQYKYPHVILNSFVCRKLVCCKILKNAHIEFNTYKKMANRAEWKRKATKRSEVQCCYHRPDWIH